MEITATAKSVKISPRKVRLVADTIRRLPIDQAVSTLQVINKRGALVLLKTLNSAIANAVTNAHMERENLQISRIDIVEGPQFIKRYHPSTRGRVHPYKKRMSHVTIALATKEGK